VSDWGFHKTSSQWQRSCPGKPSIFARMVDVVLLYLHSHGSHLNSKRCLTSPDTGFAYNEGRPNKSRSSFVYLLEKLGRMKVQHLKFTRPKLG